MKIERKSNKPQMQFTIDLMPERTGIRIWGSRMAFHDLHQGIWNCIGDYEFEGENRVNYIGILYSFAYDVRHAFMGDRLVKRNGRFILEWSDELFQRFEDDSESFTVGVEFSWPQIIFALASLRECFRLRVCPAELLPVMVDIESEVRRLLKSVSGDYFDLIAPYIDGAIYAANPYLLHVMIRVDKEYEHSRRRPSMKRLAEMMRRSLYGTKEYDDFHQLLLSAAAEEHCDVADLGME
jgi:hypothetical protein